MAKPPRSRETAAHAVTQKSHHIRRSIGNQPPAGVRQSRRGFGRLVLIFLIEIFARHLFLGHVGEFDKEVDDLLLENRCPQARDRTWIVAVILPDLLLLAGELALNRHSPDDQGSA